MALKRRKVREADEPLLGRRVLIVEDRFLIAAELADQVRRMGGRVIGPSPDLESAEAILAREGADLALLDINLRDEDVYPLARQLEAAGVPFMFLTGYEGEALPAHWRARPRITKPIVPSELRAEILKLSHGGKDVLTE